MTRPVRAGLAVAVCAAVVLTVVLTLAAAWSTRPADAADLRRAESLALGETDSPVLRAAARDCRADPAAYGVVDPVGASARASACRSALTPPPAAYLGRPDLSADQLAEVDVLVLGLGLTVTAGAAGLLLGRTERAGVAATGGAALGLLAAGGAWATLTLVLAARDLPLPGTPAVTQTVRVAALTALAAGTGSGLARWLDGPVRGLLVAAAVAALSLLTPWSVLDLAEAWVLGRW